MLNEKATDPNYIAVNMAHTKHAKFNKCCENFENFNHFLAVAEIIDPKTKVYLKVAFKEILIDDTRLKVLTKKD